jgi:hypothetical protein
LTIVLSATIINAAVGAGHVQVERQHPPGTPAGVVHRHGARLTRRASRQRPGVPRGISATAVARDPGMPSTGNRGRDRMPGSLRGGAREAVRTGQIRCCDIRRVARGQC